MTTMKLDQEAISTKKEDWDKADYPLPSKIFLSGRMDYEDKVIQVSPTETTLISSHGSTHYFSFSSIKEEKIRHIVKYYIFKRLGTNSVSTCSVQLSVIKDLITTDAFMAGSIEKIFEPLHSEEDLNKFFHVKSFIEFLCQNNIYPFEHKDYIAVRRRSPSIKYSPYQSIFLSQHTLSAEAKKRIISYLQGVDVSVASRSYLRDFIILRCCYELGLRPSQIAALNIDDFISHKSKNNRPSYFSLRATYVKQKGSVLRHQLKAISDKLGHNIEGYMGRLDASHLEKKSPLFFRDGRLSSIDISEIITIQFNFLGVDIGDIRGAATSLRHNMAQQLADKGASADEIAEAMSHSSVVAARAYIAATPEIGKIKSRALGRNNTYVHVMDMLLSERVSSAKDWQGKIPLAQVGIREIVNVGGCSASSCQFDPIHGCYGGSGSDGICESFNPFRDGDHQSVIDALEEQITSFINEAEKYGQTEKSPVILQFERILENARHIKAECDSIQNSGI